MNFFRYRNAIPQWGTFNPIKVFPETFMPLAADVAGFCVFPITHNLVSSLTIVTAGIYSFFICIYFGEISAFLHRIGVLKYNRCVAGFVYLLHFVIFKINSKGFIPYLFGAHNVTGVFHYSIPMLLNMILVLRLMLMEHKTTPEEKQFDGALIWLFVYLAVF